ncbi:MAG: DUF4838 domain-containing protein [Clostridia bacterium]|nr:DUF4838 domain-containing protein [Clostridia bacterium]
MLYISKITSDSTVDFAAEELKKYLRMMMPECGDIKISYKPGANDGFRLGLMQDFGLDVADAEDVELDDILYIDCDERGGIIAGDNPRSVLLSVYEYLRQNGCRWLFPGVDGEYIPMQDVKAVKYRHKPSCRYRGWCNEGAEFQQSMIEVIDFSPKVGNNLFMMEFRIPSAYYDGYYSHARNTENRSPEPVSDRQVLQWKRQCEAEIAKRGLQFHDIGHGWSGDPFGVDTARGWNKLDDSFLSDEDRSMLAYTILRRKAGGAGMPDEEEFKNSPRARGLWNGQPLNTNFCMSNPKAREKFVRYVADYAENHSNSTYLHVWLGDAANNHCECEECKKKTPSDWYMILLNECDRELTKRKLDTRIVFIAYVDTTWAPVTEKIENQDRFTLLLAPISRSYMMTLPEWGVKKKTVPYKRNQNVLPADLEEYFAYFADWKKMWKGANISYEYHFWRHQAFDLSGIELAKRINEDIKVYKAYDINGIIEDGSQRSFFPTGLAFYTYARSLFDISLSAEEIAEDYFSNAFGDDWKDFYDYLARLEEKIPFPYISGAYENRHYAPEMREQILSLKDVTKAGRELIKAHYNSDMRVQTFSVRLLEMHADFCDMLSDALAEKCVGNDKEALDCYEKFRVEMGRRECEFALVYDHLLYMGALFNIVFSKSSEPVLLI